MLYSSRQTLLLKGNQVKVSTSDVYSDPPSGRNEHSAISQNLIKTIEGERQWTKWVIDNNRKLRPRFPSMMAFRSRGVIDNSNALLDWWRQSTVWNRDRLLTDDIISGLRRPLMLTSWLTRFSEAGKLPKVSRWRKGQKNSFIELTENRVRSWEFTACFILVTCEQTAIHDLYRSALGVLLHIKTGTRNAWYAKTTNFNEKIKQFELNIKESILYCKTANIRLEDFNWGQVGCCNNYVVAVLYLSTDGG